MERRNKADAQATYSWKLEEVEPDVLIGLRPLQVRTQEYPPSPMGTSDSTAKNRTILPAYAWLLVAAVACMASEQQEKPPQNQTGVVLLPAFQVREPGLTDFGMSLLTNPEVAAGKKVMWIIVGDVVPRSAASTAGLRPGDKIIRVDRELVSKLSRAEMLSTFFGRMVGDRVQLEVADPLTQKHRVVDVECNQVRIDKKPAKAPAPSGPNGRSSS
jgi:hypothetical protein